jgi:protein-S-isoprenylcysteine O-methyltransferase Ste14
MEAHEMRVMAIRRFSAAALILGVIFFLSAGTIRYWQAWAYMAVLLIPAALVTRYLILHDPELLQRRLTMQEERKKQRTIQKLGSLVWLSIFLIPGLDQRFGWSSVPWLLVVFSEVIIVSGYVLFFLVMKENSYASRIIEVRQGQTVITTGPYTLVRHPMYLAVLLMLVFSPLALGSFWAMIPALFTPLVLVLRIRDEEAMLLKDLSGYREYTRQTPYRLIPGVW